MKLEVGMYVRTEYGICKIDKIETESFSTPAYHLDINDESFYYGEAWFDNLKASNNIIDLIEVGDYVNGFKVYYCYCADEDSTGLFIDTEKGRQWLDKPNQVKSIVTKEQFESTSYKVEG